MSYGRRALRRQHTKRSATWRHICVIAVSLQEASQDISIATFIPDMLIWRSAYTDADLAMISPINLLFKPLSWKKNFCIGSDVSQSGLV